MSHLKFQAYSEGKVPAYVIEFYGKGEIVIVPSQDLGEEFISELGEVRKLSAKPKGAKSFTISPKSVGKVFSGSTACFSVGAEEYHIINYERFLPFAKRGV